MRGDATDRAAGTRLGEMMIDPLLPAGATTAGADAADAAHSVDALYRSHHRRLIGLAAAVTFDRSVAEEIVHDAFAGLTARLGTDRDPVRDPVAYLRRSVVNLGIHHVRRRDRLRRLPEPPPTVVAIPELSDLWTLVADLPVQQRAVVALRFWEDLGHAQIAVVLAIPVGTVKSTLHRALSRLKEQL